MSLTSVLLSKLLSALSEQPGVVDILDFDGWITFLGLIQLLKPTLLLSQSIDEMSPLECLPLNVHEFLKICLNLDHEGTKAVWNAFQDIAWSLEVGKDGIESFGWHYIQLFLDHGASQGIDVNSYILVVFKLRVFQHSTISCHQHGHALIPLVFIPTMEQALCCIHRCSQRQWAIKSQYLSKILDWFQEYLVPCIVDVRLCFSFTFSSCLWKTSSMSHHPNYYIHKKASCQTYSDSAKVLHPTKKYYIFPKFWGLVTILIIYKYSIYIFDMNRRSGSHALLHAGKSEKNEVLTAPQILHVRVWKNMKN